MHLIISKQNSLSMKKILLIEKDEDIRSNLAQVLELVNYEVFTAEDGLRAAELAKR
jgi:CRP/FNR family cyclic AMP-dependent transcriptional regulator